MTSNKSNIYNIRANDLGQLIKPKELKEKLPIEERDINFIKRSRNEIEKVLDGEDKRFLIIVGPCSIHKKDEALDYARRLSQLKEAVKDKIIIVMRTYFEKPRTIIGWKGLIKDPNLDGSAAINLGLYLAREIMLEITRLNLACATEALDVMIPQYISDLVSYSAIGARTCESQLHRELASGLSMPVGFKNSTDGSVDMAINGIKAANAQHVFIGINEDAVLSIFSTSGNKYAHLILRGGRNGPNYEQEFVNEAINKLRKANVCDKIIIDCSHDNTLTERDGALVKDYRRQEHVFLNVLEQRLKGNENIVGASLESNINEGNQPLSDELAYGISITDACIGWELTEKLIMEAYRHL
ncbi:MAG: 3-deoxy-7-phosphoheptulonate synthase [Candidatus Anstonellales archaeon]